MDGLQTVKSGTMKSRYVIVKVIHPDKDGWHVARITPDGETELLEHHVCRCTAEDSLKQYRKKEREDRRNQKKGAEK